MEDVWLQLRMERDELGWGWTDEELRLRSSPEAEQALSGCIDLFFPGELRVEWISDDDQDLDRHHVGIDREPGVGQRTKERIDGVKEQRPTLLVQHLPRQPSKELRLELQDRAKSRPSGGFVLGTQPVPYGADARAVKQVEETLSDGQ